jgi:hypothetical protein
VDQVAPHQLAFGLDQRARQLADCLAQTLDLHRRTHKSISTGESTALGYSATWRARHGAMRAASGAQHDNRRAARTRDKRQRHNCQPNRRTRRNGQRTIPTRRHALVNAASPISNCCCACRTGIAKHAVSCASVASTLSESSSSAGSASAAVVAIDDVTARRLRRDLYNQTYGASDTSRSRVNRLLWHGRSTTLTIFIEL